LPEHVLVIASTVSVSPLQSTLIAHQNEKSLGTVCSFSNLRFGSECLCFTSTLMGDEFSFALKQISWHQVSLNYPTVLNVRLFRNTSVKGV